ncbi:MAG: hypothetical protein AAGE18_15865 [Pseudomonadota bacterium]
MKLIPTSLWTALATVFLASAIFWTTADHPYNGAARAAPQDEAFLACLAEQPDAPASSRPFRIIVTALADDDGGTSQSTRVAQRVARLQESSELFDVTVIPCAVGDFGPIGGRFRAMDLLEESGADIVLWGIVRGSRREIELHLTTRDQSTMRTVSTDFEDYVGDMLVVNLLDSIDRASRDAADPILALVQQIQTLTTPLTEDLPGGMDHADRGALFFYHAWALQRIGSSIPDPAQLNAAIAAHRRAAFYFERAGYRAGSARGQVELALALLTLGEITGDAASVAEGVSVLRPALEEVPSFTMPEQWEIGRANLRSTLFKFGHRTLDETRLEQVVLLLRFALEEITQTKAPEDWAFVQKSLGDALALLGELRGEAAQLEDAVAAYRSALQQRTRDRAPDQWAELQNNLGAALLLLGQVEDDTERLEEAREALWLALDQWSSWVGGAVRARAQYNLARIEFSFFQRTAESAYLDFAVEHATAARADFRGMGMGDAVAVVEELLADLLAARP